MTDPVIEPNPIQDAGTVPSLSRAVPRKAVVTVARVVLVVTPIEAIALTVLTLITREPAGTSLTHVWIWSALLIAAALLTCRMTRLPRRSREVIEQLEVTK